MNVRLLCFAQCSDIVGSREKTVGLPEGSTVGTLLDQLITEYPPLGRLERSMMLSVNQEYVEREHILTENDEVALITPVSGG